LPSAAAKIHHGETENTENHGILFCVFTVVHIRDLLFFSHSFSSARQRPFATNAFTGDPTKPDEATRAYYAGQYALPGAMRAGFAHFTAFSQDVEDNKIFQRTKLSMPVLAVGGEKSFGATGAAVMRNVATNVREAVVPGADHWLIKESRR